MEPEFSQEKDASSSGSKPKSRQKDEKKSSRDNNETGQTSTEHDTRQDESETKDTTSELRSEENQALEATGVKRKIRKQKKKKRSSQNMKEESQKEETIVQPSKKPVAEESETEEKGTSTWYEQKCGSIETLLQTLSRVPPVSNHIFRSANIRPSRSDNYKAESDCCRVPLEDKDFCGLKKNCFVCRNPHQNLSNLEKVLPTVVQKYKMTTRFLNHRMQSYIFLCTVCKVVEFGVLQMEQHLRHHTILRHLPCEECCQGNMDISIIIKKTKYNIPTLETKRDFVWVHCTKCKKVICSYNDVLVYSFDMKFLKIIEGNKKAFKTQLASTCHFCWKTFRLTRWKDLSHHLVSNEHDESVFCIKCFLDLNLSYAMESLKIDK